MRIGERGTDLPDYHPGAMIEQHRINMGLTIADVTRDGEITSHAWSRIERGLVKYPEWTTVCRMLAAMRAKVDITYNLEPVHDPGKLHV